MAFTIIREDLARVQADAIVVPANKYLEMNGGVGLTVAKAAGLWRLRRACKRLGGCPVGNAVATPAYKLSASHIIHAVGPVWRGGDAGEPELLRSAYRNALELALRLNAKSVALPLLSAGTFGYPIREAFEIAVESIREFLEHADMDVILVLFDKRAVVEGSQRFGEIAEYIDDAYADAHVRPNMSRHRYYREEFEDEYRDAFEADQDEWGAWEGYGQSISLHVDSVDRHESDYLSAAPRSAEPAPSPGKYPPRGAAEPRHSFAGAAASHKAPTMAPPRPKTAARESAPAPKLAEDTPVSLSDVLAKMDAPFSTMLMQLIDARGLTDAQVYKRANISRQHFSKMRNPDYRPTKKTVVALAIALELPLEDMRDLLARAGFALSHSEKFDLIVEYFVSRGDYDIFEINEALFAYDQPLLS